ncbi:fused MFS/spermidine synthase [Candidatus Falkowbacteria bacterium]|nr:fused MFS/spermidine synthase [Candidatus Falkowbacteria bacterium]
MFNQKFKLGKLELIVFIGGTSVMVLELIGSRIVAPYLGTSIFVWSALIGIILGALSLGYHLGGRFSAKNPRISFLLKILFLAGLSILLISVIKDFVLYYSAALGVKWGSVTATLALFTLPSIILGMVSPYAIRLKIESLENSGGVAGNLYALSTIGSIFGTFLAGFYLIPTFTTSQILFGLSFVLIATSLLGGKKIAKIVSLIAITGFFAVSAGTSSNYVFETDSAYNHIRVADLTDPKTKQDIRVMFLATETHSIIYKDSAELFSPYHEIYLLDNLFAKEINKALTLGGGGYIAPMNFLSRYPNAEMTVVEIDPEVTATAKKYFNLRDDPRLTIYHEDGRIFLNQNKDKYDVIYGDAYASYYSLPFQLTTFETIQKIYDSLNEGGVFILNMISSLKGEKSKFFQTEYKTISEVFPQLYVFPARFYDDQNQDKVQNIVIVAAKSDQKLSKDELLSRADPKQKILLENLFEEPINFDSDIKVLTDEFAPVDYYISKLL